MDIRLSHRRPRFELGRGIVAEAGLSAQPIIKHFNVLKDILRHLVSCTVLTMITKFALECAEEAFDTGIVPVVASAAHAGGDAMLAEQPLIATCRILAPAIRVVQQPGPGCPMRQRHGEGPLGQLHGQPMARSPADHRARI